MAVITIAIIDSNRLSAMGLQQILQNITPGVELVAYTSFEEFVMEQEQDYMHYFVSSGIYFEHATYFQQQAHRSIVLVHSDNYPRIAGLLTLNVCQDEAGLTRSLLQLYSHGHGAASHRPHPHTTIKREANDTLLTPREIEVAILLAKGHINKEVANILHISLTTVICHRKNIMDKLQARSLADIIVYVVRQAFVTLEELDNSTFSKKSLASQ